MYQTAASETITALIQDKDCLQVPLISYAHRGLTVSLNTLLVYQQQQEQQQQQKTQDTSAAAPATPPPHDEVEDLYLALRLAQCFFSQLKAVASGAILSTY